MKIKSLLTAGLVFIFLFTGCSSDEDAVVFQDVSYETDFNPVISELKSTNIPIVDINVNNNKEITSKAIWESASFSITGEFCGESDLNNLEISIKGRGNSSWNLPKKPYSIKLSSKEKILGMKKSKRWVLIANYSDKTLLRNYFFSRLGNDLYNTTWNPQFKSVNLIVNGKYRGVYLLGEQIRIDSNRVNISDISDLNDGGFIFEINNKLDELYNFITKHFVCISLKDPDDITPEKQSIVKRIITEAEDALFSENFTDPIQGYRSHFEVNSVIDWYIMNELGKNADAADFSSIYYYYDPSDNLLHMGPIWDFDISCGNIGTPGLYTYSDLYIRNNSRWIHRMFEDPWFREKVQLRWNAKKSILYEYITINLQEYADNLSLAEDLNFKKWEILGKYTWPYCPGYEYRTTYQNEIDYMTQWLIKRYEVMNDAYSNS